MPPRCLPADPAFRSEAERLTWEALRRRLRDSDVLIANLRMVSRDGNWEVDLIVLMPEGFATIEVKGGYVHRSEGQWLQETADGSKVIDLDEQSLSGMYLVRRSLEDRWSFGKPRMAHFVALPDTELGAEDPSPGLPRTRIIGRGELGDAAERIRATLTGTLINEPKREPGPAAVDAAADLLGGVADPARDTAARTAMRSAHVDALAAQQYPLLDFIAEVDRYQVSGGPGSGKTWLALEQARRWAAAGQRVALVCYSRGLATWIRRRVAELPAPEAELITAGTFHSLGLAWGETVPGDADPQFWEETLPQRMLQRATDLPDAARFEAIVVDEAQDFADSWWPPLLAALRDREAGRLAVFGDDGQRIFGRTGRPSVELVPLRLDRNLRNTRQIAAVFRPLSGRPPTELLGGVGPEVRFHACPTADAISTADDAAVALLDEGWAPDQVALLTTHHRHPMHLERSSAGTDAYWESFWDDSDLFYGTVLGSKGLERPVVVLAVDGFRDEERARDLLYVGLSRARDLLVVCGDLAEIRRLGGKELAKRLDRVSVAD